MALRNPINHNSGSHVEQRPCPRTDFQPIILVTLHFFFIRIWGQPGSGSERPALFSGLQSQGRGKSPETKPWGLLGAQVTPIYKMSLFKNQVQISLLVFFQGVGEGAVISSQGPSELCLLCLASIESFPSWLWHQTELGRTKIQLYSSSWVSLPIKLQCSFKSLQVSSLGLAVG